MVILILWMSVEFMFLMTYWPVRDYDFWICAIFDLAHVVHLFYNSVLIIGFDLIDFFMLNLDLFQYSYFMISF
uniref:Uncharacterized protein n=1 Tax=Sphenifaro virus TaxID=2780019 RepID=A0AC59MR45_9PICO|nr:MAG: hypothetical protein [Sphenifaro virus]